MNTDTELFVYHSNIHIQHHVREVERSKYPGKNTKVKHFNTFWHKSNILKLCIYKVHKYI
jgi:hypothetical protein